jgi:hypothetical protein
MTQEEKQLLLRDLCARLPYGVMVENVLNHEVFDLSKYLHCLPAALENFKPYLRPMSSMTEEEEDEYMIARQKDIAEAYIHATPQNAIDWLNSHHFDYRGLIEKGFAIEAPEGMYDETPV